MVGSKCKINQNVLEDQKAQSHEEHVINSQSKLQNAVSSYTLQVHDFIIHANTERRDFCFCASTLLQDILSDKTCTGQKNDNDVCTVNKITSIPRGSIFKIMKFVARKLSMHQKMQNLKYKHDNVFKVSILMYIHPI